MNRYKKTVIRILETYVEEERKQKESNPELGHAAWDVLSKKTKGRIIDSFLASKIVSLKIDDLVKTHSSAFYSPQDVLWKIRDKEPIQVIKHKGKYLVMDGHHRLLIHRILDKKNIKAYLIDLDKKKKRKKK